MNAYTDLTDAGVPTRAAAGLTGLSRATATRQAARARRPEPEPVPRPEPVNKLSCDERTRVLAVLNSAEFVDKPPLQV